MKLIVGLGNIGKEYSGTRHNIGFDCVDMLAKDLGASAFIENKKFFGSVAEIVHENEKIILLKPSTYMNNSGQAVSALAQFYKIESNDIWVIYDELDIESGKLKISTGGNSGGHNGVESIIEKLGTKDFMRFRIGIHFSTLKQFMEGGDYVLGKFSAEEKLLLKDSCARAILAIKRALRDGIPSAQNEFN